MCPLRCLWCRRTAEPPNDDHSEDSEVYWIRRRREEREREKDQQRQEFLENVLLTKKVVLMEESIDASSDEFILETQGDMSCAICLVDYDAGDQVSFSHNPSCNHHFHRECIISWLKNHDACPCCRQDFLSFGDEADQGIIDGVSENEYIPSYDFEMIANNHSPSNETRNNQLDRLYGTGDFEINPEPTRSTGLNSPSPPEPFEARLDRILERLGRQMEEQVQTARAQIRERREEHRRRREDGNSDGEERRIERSIQLVRDQLTRLREVASREVQNHRDRDHASTTPTDTSRGGLGERNRQDRLEDAIQVVRSRLNDIAHSEQANRIRERSTRTMQNLLRQASSRR